MERKVLDMVKKYIHYLRNYNTLSAFLKSPDKRDSATRFSTSGFFHELVAKFAAVVVDTGGKFAAGVVDTGGAPWLSNISANF